MSWLNNKKHRQRIEIPPCVNTIFMGCQFCKFQAQRKRRRVYHIEITTDMPTPNQFILKWFQNTDNSLQATWEFVNFIIRWIYLFWHCLYGSINIFETNSPFFAGVSSTMYLCLCHGACSTRCTHACRPWRESRGRRAKRRQYLWMRAAIVSPTMTGNAHIGSCALSCAPPACELFAGVWYACWLIANRPWSWYSRQTLFMGFGQNHRNCASSTDFASFFAIN